jgi:hypothetical protein
LPEEFKDIYGDIYVEERASGGPPCGSAVYICGYVGLYAWRERGRGKGEGGSEVVVGETQTFVNNIYAWGGREEREGVVGETQTFVDNIYAWGGREEREGVVGETQTRGVSVVVARRSARGVAGETQTRDLSVIVAQTRRN